MKKRLGFLHAHHSNIAYLEQAVAPYEMECVHFVDPTLIHRMKTDLSFTREQAQHKLHEQIESLVFSQVDIIVITCTNYSSIVQESKLDISIPIIKIDEPYFAYLAELNQPQTLIFTNPTTVDGTIACLENYLLKHNKTLDYQVQVIPDSFELVMQGLTEQYDMVIADYLHSSYDSTRVISVAQLSMVNGAKKFEFESSLTIINPLNTLIPIILSHLDITYSSH